MELHKIQRELFNLLKENVDDPLTIRDLQSLLGLSTPSLVHHHILQLEKKKVITRNPNNTKDYKILNDPDNTMSYVNLYGMAQCGPDGTILSGDPIDRIPLSPKVISFSITDAFLVVAAGESMEPDIHEGDFIVGKAQSSAEKGDIIICTKDELVMVKKYIINEDGVMLVSINKEFDPILVSPDSEFHIEGVVKGLICNHK